MCCEFSLELTSLSFPFALAMLSFSFCLNFAKLFFVSITLTTHETPYITALLFSNNYCFVASAPPAPRSSSSPPTPPPSRPPCSAPPKRCSEVRTDCLITCYTSRKIH